MSIQPSSTAGREAPTAAPRASARDFDDREALRPLAAAAAGHDDVRLGQIDTLGGSTGHGLHDASEVGCVSRGRDDLGGAGGVDLGHRERLRAHRGHHGGGGCGYTLDHLGGVGQAREEDLVASLDIHHVREQRRIQGLGQKRGRYARFGAVGEQYHGRGALGGQPGQRAGHGLGGRCGPAFHNHHAVGTPRGERLGVACGGRAPHDGDHLSGRLVGQRPGAPQHLRHLPGAAPHRRR